MANCPMQLDGLESIDYAVVHIADFAFKPGFRSSGHLGRTELYYCLSGSAEVCVGNQDGAVHSGMIFCCGTGTFRDFRSDEEAPLHAVLLGLEGRRIADMIADAQGAVDKIYLPSNSAAIYNVVNAMLKSAADFEPYAPQICRHYLPVLLTTIKQGFINTDGDQRETFQTFLRCRKFIDQNHIQIQRIERVAAENHISHEYLCRLFKRYSDISPSAYLMRLKMNIAVQVLQSGNTPIKSIAHQLGFANQSVFSKAFKRILGLSPSDLRRGISVKG